MFLCINMRSMKNNEATDSALPYTVVTTLFVFPHIISVLTWFSHGKITVGYIMQIYSTTCTKLVALNYIYVYSNTRLYHWTISMAEYDHREIG